MYLGSPRSELSTYARQDLPEALFECFEDEAFLRSLIGQNGSPRAANHSIALTFYQHW